MHASMPCVLQTAKLIAMLSDNYDNLSSVLVKLKAVEGELSAPGTGVAGQPHQAIDDIARTSQELNDVLRRVDQAQAELPPIRDASQMPTAQELARVRLNDVDAATAVRCPDWRCQWLLLCLNVLHGLNRNFHVQCACLHHRACVTTLCIQPCCVP